MLGTALLNAPVPFWSMAGLVVPPAPNAWSLLTGWEFDPFVIVAAFAGAGYLLGVRRVQERGRRWPAGRTASFLAGVVCIAYAVSGGLAEYDRVLFSAHVAQHLLLGMVGPLLLVLGAPLTLALQASNRRLRTRLLRIVRSRPVAFLTHPVTAWFGFAGTLVVLYSTGLYEASLRHDAVHALLHAQFVLVGIVFMAHVVGVDPIGHALGFGARALYVSVALPFHGFLGVALLSSNRVIARSWYAHLHRSWGPSLLDDQRIGAGLLWVAGELFGLVALLIVVAQWMRSDERAAARHDRREPLERGQASPRQVDSSAWRSASVSSTPPKN